MQYEGSHGLSGKESIQHLMGLWSRATPIMIVPIMIRVIDAVLI